MNRLTQPLLVALFLLLAAGSAWAQDHSRGWEEGTVWSITHVHTKPGMYNAYINDLNNVWRRYLDEEKKDGGVVSYSMFANAFPRQGEPDLFLAVEYANWAAFDRGAEYFEKLAAKMQGSPDAAREASLDRGALREIGSNYVLQEVKFKE